MTTSPTKAAATAFTVLCISALAGAGTAAQAGAPSASGGTWLTSAQVAKLVAGTSVASHRSGPSYTQAERRALIAYAKASFSQRKLILAR